MTRPVQMTVEEISDVAANALARIAERDEGQDLLAAMLMQYGWLCMRPAQRKEG